MFQYLVALSSSNRHQLLPFSHTKTVRRRMALSRMILRYLVQVRKLRQSVVQRDQVA